MTRRWNILAGSILILVFFSMVLYLLLNPTRTGVVPNYRFAASHWWISQSMYPGGTHGFLYVPTFAVLFSPIYFLRPEILGEILWRAFGFGLFGLGLWRLAGNLSRQQGWMGTSDPTLLWVVLLAVPASLASLHNGQTNLPLSACLVLAAVALRDRKWNQAAFLLSLSLVLKPVALAPWLLACAVIPALRIPLLLGLPVLALVGFLHPNPSYSWGQWAEFLHKLTASYTPENLRVSDLFGALGKWGILVPPALEKGTRALASLGALAWVWRSYRQQGLARASWALWVATALVFTIFNPRAETNSYVLISPLLAFAAVHFWREGARDRWKGWILAVACLGLMCDGMGKTIYLATDVWFKPLIVLLVSPLLFRMPESWRAETQ